MMIVQLMMVGLVHLYLLFACSSFLPVVMIVFVLLVEQLYHQQLDLDDELEVQL